MMNKGLKGLCKMGVLIGMCWLAALPAVAQPGNPPNVQPTVAHADAIYFEALKARARGDNRQEEALLKQFIAQRPDVAAAYYDLAQVSVRLSRPDEAMQYVKKAMALDGENLWYQDLYAQLLDKSGKHTEAAEILLKLADKAKLKEEYLLRAALSYQLERDYKKALGIYDRLLGMHVGDEELLLKKHELQVKMGDLDDAAKTLQTLIASDPQEPRYYAILAEMYDENKQTAKALEVYQQAEQRFPEDLYILIGLADHYKRQNNTERYDYYVNRAITAKGLDAETQLSILMPYVQEMINDTLRREKGVDIAAKLAQQYPDNAQVLAIYGDLLSITGKQEAAVAQYKRALAIDPSRYNVWQQVLFSYTDRKSADSLIAYSEKALRLFPNQALVHYLNGIGHINKGNTASAIKAINRAIDMQPEENQQLLGEMYSSLGDAYNTARQYSASDSAYNAALRLQPDNASVLNNYSYYLSVRGIRLDDAERMSKRSLELRPNEATFMDTYGWILYKSGQYDKAREYIQRAIDANPTGADATLWDHLGDVYYKLKDTDKAVQHWQKAKELGSDNQYIDKKIQERKLYE